MQAHHKEVQRKTVQNCSIQHSLQPLTHRAVLIPVMEQLRPLTGMMDNYCIHKIIYNLINYDIFYTRKNNCTFTYFDFSLYFLICWSTVLFQLIFQNCFSVMTTSQGFIAE